MRSYDESPRHKCSAQDFVRCDRVGVSLRAVALTEPVFVHYPARRLNH
jgi:hypothetical protein